MVALSHVRGLLPEEERRMCRFLSYQRIGARSGLIIGRRGYHDADGGMALAERYAAVHGLAEGTFWVDLKRLMRRGLAEQRVKPAPGRKAAYALVLTADAIPHDLPEDLARALHVWDLPAGEDRHEDARYGRLSAEADAFTLAYEPMAVELDSRTSAELNRAPRWQHPADSQAAAVAAEIRSSAVRLDEADRPALASMAVAPSNASDRFAARFSGGPETSPLYATAIG
ncbi:hypothetical protein NLX86_30100 [Streptomyces sp. A3M-1-3]|uniref:hypothetical protein n=1 Tax=Streptomyces sp. A3M-1-3 TaxID=2962044 RepID=UPI0020B81783|nr:hypothetical protein [Streptomyces sp. A3M-1-3]MCP3822190.1 hypothetical protein [Streptomyces sp. A3M-1-3]